MPIVEITNPKATLDGGDVLFTGHEFFVGISNRTNEAGAQALADSFPEFTVTPIDLPKKTLHLKSCISMAGPDIICVSSSLEAQLILKVSSQKTNIHCVGIKNYLVIITSYNILQQQLYVQHLMNVSFSFLLYSELNAILPIGTIQLLYLMNLVQMWHISMEP